MRGPFLSREYGTLGRKLIVFLRVKTVLEEYVGSSFKDQKGIVSHKSIHNIAQSVISCKSLPPRAYQGLDPSS